MLREQDFINKDIPSVDKTVKVLQYLNQGRSLKIGDVTFRLGQTHTDGFKLLVEFSEDQYVGYVGDMDDFSSACNKLTDEEMTVMAANMALTKINKR